MSATGTRRPTLETRPLLIAAVLLSALLAYFLPYDRAVNWITLDVPILRAVLMLAVWAAGLALQRANGLSLPVHGFRRPVLSLVLTCAAVAVWCLLLDGWVFRGALPAGHNVSEHRPLALRIAYYASRAFNENVLYRLFLGALFGWALRLAMRAPKHRAPALMLGMALAQVLNVGVSLGLDNLTPVVMAWMLLRFVLPGTLWGWLYVRHGFAANEAAAMGVHVFLQPLVSLVFV
jgi:hypothetical protein